MTRVRHLAAAVPQGAWLAIAGLALIASLAITAVIGAGLQAWRGGADGVSQPPRSALAPPGSGLVVVPSPPSHPRSPSTPGQPALPQQPTTPVAAGGNPVVAGPGTPVTPLPPVVAPVPTPVETGPPFGPPPGRPVAAGRVDSVVVVGRGLQPVANGLVARTSAAVGEKTKDLRDDDAVGPAAVHRAATVAHARAAAAAAHREAVHRVAQARAHARALALAKAQAKAHAAPRGAHGHAPTGHGHAASAHGHGHGHGHAAVGHARHVRYSKD